MRKFYQPSSPIEIIVDDSHFTYKNDRAAGNHGYYTQGEENVPLAKSGNCLPREYSRETPGLDCHQPVLSLQCVLCSPSCQHQWQNMPTGVHFGEIDAIYQHHPDRQYIFGQTWQAVSVQKHQLSYSKLKRSRKDQVCCPGC